MNKQIVATEPVDFADRLVEFRAGRLSVISEHKPIHLEEGAKVVLHLVPSDGFDQSRSVNLALNQPLRPLFVGGSYRFNFDGLLTYSDGTDHIRSYVQLFHNGIIEAVYVFVDRGDKRVIPSTALESNLIEATQSYLSAQRRLEVKPPIGCLLTLVGVDGFRLGIGSRSLSYDPFPFDRDRLLFPEQFFETFEVSVEQILKPLFDRVWNAAGLPKCLNYDQAGRWSSNGA